MAVAEVSCCSCKHTHSCICIADVVYQGIPAGIGPRQVIARGLQLKLPAAHVECSIGCHLTASCSVVEIALCLHAQFDLFMHFWRHK